MPASQASPSKQMRATWFAGVSLASALFALAAVALLHLLSPEFDPITRPMSDYAVGRFGFLMASAICALGVSVLSLARALSACARRAGITLLNLAGVTYIVAGIFPSDALPDETVISVAGAVHFIAGYAASPMIVSAAILLARSNASSREPRAFAFALALWATLITLVVVNTLHLNVGGFGQRIFMGMIWLWVFLTARRAGKSLDL
ncbi:MAG: DUF998 domain-containing protein [Chloroflexi bacterium]|nr:DUF998 domain-containing protein [Chloroflexota bacterium]